MGAKDYIIRQADRDANPGKTSRQIVIERERKKRQAEIKSSSKSSSKPKTINATPKAAAIIQDASSNPEFKGRVPEAVISASKKQINIEETKNPPVLVTENAKKALEEARPYTKFMPVTEVSEGSDISRTANLKYKTILYPEQASSETAAKQRAAERAFKEGKIRRSQYEQTLNKISKEKQTETKSKIQEVQPQNTPSPIDITNSYSELPPGINPLFTRSPKETIIKQTTVFNPYNPKSNLIKPQNINPTLNNMFSRYYPNVNYLPQGTMPREQPYLNYLFPQNKQPRFQRTTAPSPQETRTDIITKRKQDDFLNFDTKVDLGRQPTPQETIVYKQPIKKTYDFTGVSLAPATKIIQPITENKTKQQTNIPKITGFAPQRQPTPQETVVYKQPEIIKQNPIIKGNVPTRQLTPQETIGNIQPNTTILNPIIKGNVPTRQPTPQETDYIQPNTTVLNSIIKGNIPSRQPTPQETNSNLISYDPKNPLNKIPIYKREKKIRLTQKQIESLEVPTNSPPSDYFELGTKPILKQNMLLKDSKQKPSVSDKILNYELDKFRRIEQTQSDFGQKTLNVANILSQPLAILPGIRIKPYEERGYFGKTSALLVNTPLSIFPGTIATALKIEPIITTGAISATTKKKGVNAIGKGLTSPFVSSEERYKQFRKGFNPLTPEGASLYLTAGFLAGLKTYSTYREAPIAPKGTKSKSSTSSKYITYDDKPYGSFDGGELVNYLDDTHMTQTTIPVKPVLQVKITKGKGGYTSTQLINLVTGKTTGQITKGSKTSVVKTAPLSGGKSSIYTKTNYFNRLGDVKQITPFLKTIATPEAVILSEKVIPKQKAANSINLKEKGYSDKFIQTAQEGSIIETTGYFKKGVFGKEYFKNVEYVGTKQKRITTSSAETKTMGIFREAGDITTGESKYVFKTVQTKADYPNLVSGKISKPIDTVEIIGKPNNLQVGNILFSEKQTKIIKAPRILSDESQALRIYGSSTTGISKPKTTKPKKKSEVRYIDDSISDIDTYNYNKQLIEQKQTTQPTKTTQQTTQQTKPASNVGVGSLSPTYSYDPYVQQTPQPSLNILRSPSQRFGRVIIPIALSQSKSILGTNSINTLKSSSSSELKAENALDVNNKLSQNNILTQKIKLNSIQLNNQMYNTKQTNSQINIQELLSRTRTKQKTTQKTQTPIPSPFKPFPGGETPPPPPPPSPLPIIIPLPKFKSGTIKKKKKSRMGLGYGERNFNIASPLRFLLGRK